MSWLIYSILATVFLGFSMVFYKLPSYKDYSSFISTILTNTISAALVIIVLCITDKVNTAQHISWYGLAWGATFSVSMVLFKKLLKGRDSGIIFPAVSSIGNAFTIIVGLVFLSEKISFIQILGILTILLSIYFFQKKDGKLTFNAEALWFSLGIVIFSTTQKFIQKLGATHDSVEQFLAYQYFGAAVFGFVLALIFDRKNLSEILKPKKYLKGAFLISIFSVMAGYVILKALTLVPLSKVYAVQPIYTLVTAVLGVWLFKEKLTTNKLLLVLVSIIGVVLLRIG